MNPKKHEDHNFSSFATGVSIGVVAALLFGTEEGRKLVKNILDSIPEKYKKVPEALSPSKIDYQNVPPTPIIVPQETPHHTTFDIEAPPPPAPSVHPTASTKIYPDYKKLIG
jgi:hypothetical protein